MDTLNLAPNESLDLIMDFTDPVIRGVSVFHCHLLKHEDKGMMAKIIFSMTRWVRVNAALLPHLRRYVATPIRPRLLQLR
jgi:hypothetical protein